MNKTFLRFKRWLSGMLNHEGWLFRSLRPWYERFYVWQARRMFRGTKSIQRAVVSSKMVGGFTITATGIIAEFRDGARFVYRPDDKTDLLSINVNLHGGDYEPEVRLLTSQLLRPGDVAFDVGANFGWFTDFFSRCVGSKGKVYAFEPNPSEFGKLSNNLELNDWRNVALFQTALGDREGDINFYVPKSYASAFASALPDFASSSMKMNIITVPMTTLDDFCKREHIERLDFIKCDVEGYEFSLFKHGLSALRSLKPIVLAEVGEKASRELFSFFVGLGCSVFYYKDGQLLPFVDYHGVLPDYNFLFVPAEKKDRIRSLLAV
jgi:FkbM family methyltransferase